MFQYDDLALIRDLSREKKLKEVRGNILTPIFRPVENFCYFSDTIEARGGTFDSLITRTRSGWSRFGELMFLLTSRGSPIIANSRLYSACVRSMEARLGQLKRKL